ncbi:MAG: chemotaxis protein CheD [Dethiobacteria bacterium]|jgi:chemotaxis protein CheD|nr:chemotaxis protein CheD [Bacillota bacterium]
MDVLQVKIADLQAARNSGLLITVGLGSCLGVSLYDAQNKVAGLAHILLADSKPFKENGRFGNPAKFVDTAIPLLMKKMTALGGIPEKFVAKIAGGSQIFYSANNLSNIGEKNIKAARKILDFYQVPIVGEDVGGNYGRTMRLFVNSGRVLISTAGKGEREI